MMRYEHEIPSVGTFPGSKHAHVNVAHDGGSFFVRVQEWAGAQFNDGAASMVGIACGGPIRCFC